MTGVKGHCVGRLCCVFVLPPDTLTHWFSCLGCVPPKYLMYVEWFTPFLTSPDQNHLLYKISKLKVHGEQQVSIVLVQPICQSVHLLPKFGPVAQDKWKSVNILHQEITILAIAPQSGTLATFRIPCDVYFSHMIKYLYLASDELIAPAEHLLSL